MEADRNEFSFQLWRTRELHGDRQNPLPFGALTVNRQLYERIRSIMKHPPGGPHGAEV